MKVGEEHERWHLSNLIMTGDKILACTSHLVCELIRPIRCRDGSGARANEIVCVRLRYSYYIVF